MLLIKIDKVELIAPALHRLGYFEEKPLCIAIRVHVSLHYQVVFLLTEHFVGLFEVATLEVALELQRLLRGCGEVGRWWGLRFGRREVPCLADVTDVYWVGVTLGGRFWGLLVAVQGLVLLRDVMELW